MFVPVWSSEVLGSLTGCCLDSIICSRQIIPHVINAYPRVIGVRPRVISNRVTRCYPLCNTWIIGNGLTKNEKGSWNVELVKNV